MSGSPKIPYNDLPLLPPDLELIETREILNACINARSAIAELKTAGELIPVQQGIAKRQTASVYLKQLVEIGVLEEMSVGREKLYLNTKLLQELNQ